MSKNNTFLGDVTDSTFIGAIAYSIFKVIVILIKIIGIIIFWPIALIVKVTTKK